MVKKITKGMRRRTASCAAVILTACVLLLPGAEEDVLKVKVSIQPKSLSRSEEGKVILKITVQEGITISPHPAFTIEFGPSRELVFPKNFFTATDLDIEVLEENEEQYLNLEKPIAVPFTVSLEANRGSHILEGKVKYFARSRQEGWCLKHSAKFSASFFTRQSIIKKRP